MTPLERMAKAKWDAQAYRVTGVSVDGTYGGWDQLGYHMQRQQMEDMRAALLSLTEGELPGDAVEAGLAEWSNIRDIFKAIIRAIAEEKTQ